MRRRLYTAPTAWPALADLMTILAVVGLTAAGIVLSEVVDVTAQNAALEDEVRARQKRIDELETRLAETEGTDPGSLRDRIEDLRDDNESLKRDIADSEEDNRRLRDLIGKVGGFLPCWPGEANRLYYFAYDLTWLPAEDGRSIPPRDGRYRIAAHSDMNVPSVAPVVDADLSIMRAVPVGEIDRRTLERFAENVEQARKEAYDDNCRLAVTLNGEAPGDVVKFIHDVLRFYPVYR